MSHRQPPLQKGAREKNTANSRMETNRFLTRMKLRQMKQISKEKNKLITGKSKFGEQCKSAQNNGNYEGEK